MYTDHILEEKWRIQKLLAKNADYDVNKLMKNVHSSIIRLKAKLNVKLKYSNREGGYINSTAKE
jgi:hypothetical protein